MQQISDTCVRLFFCCLPIIALNQFTNFASINFDKIIQKFKQTNKYTRSTTKTTTTITIHKKYLSKKKQKYFRLNSTETAKFEQNQFYKSKNKYPKSICYAKCSNFVFLLRLSVSILIFISSHLRK